MEKKLSMWRAGRRCVAENAIARRRGGAGWKERKLDDFGDSFHWRLFQRQLTQHFTQFSHSLAQYFLLRRYVLHVRPLGRRRRGRGSDDALLLSLFHVAHGRVEYQHLIGPDHVWRHCGDDNDITAVLRTKTQRRRRRRWRDVINANYKYDIVFYTVP